MYQRDKEYYIKKLLENLSKEKVPYHLIKSVNQEDLNEYIEYKNKEIKKHNYKRSEIIESNRLKAENFIKNVLDTGVDEWKIYKKKKRGRGWSAKTVRGDMYAHWKKVVEDIKDYVPFHRGEFKPITPKVYNVELQDGNLVPVNMEGKETTADGFYKEVKTSILKYNEASLKLNKHVQACLKWLGEHGDVELPNDCFAPEDIINFVEDLAKAEYHESMKGEVIDVAHGDGDDCEWEVGDHRCVCGNNRYYLEVEGSLLSGHYCYGQWC